MEYGLSCVGTACSRLVMYYGAKGGTVFATGAVMSIGGL